MILVFLKHVPVFLITVLVLTVQGRPELSLRSELEVYDSLLREIGDVTRQLVNLEDLNDEEPDLSKLSEVNERQVSFSTGSDGSHTLGVNAPFPGGSIGGSVTTDKNGHVSGGSLGGTIGEGVQGSASVSYDKDKGIGGSAGIGVGAGGYGTDAHVGWNAKEGFSTGVGASAGPVGMSVDTNGHSTSSTVGITAGGSSSHTPSHSHSSGGFFHDLFGKRDKLYDALSEEDIKDLFERQVSLSTGSDGSHTLGVNAPFPGGSVGGSVTTDKNGHVSGGSFGGTIGEGVQGSLSVSYDKDKGIGGSAGIGVGAGGYGTDAHVGWNAKDGFSTGVGASAGPVGMSVDTNGHSTSSTVGLTAGGSSSHTPSSHSHSSGGFFHDLFGKRDNLFGALSEEDIKELFERQII